MSLPLRLGGLGLIRQELMKPIAAGCSFILCQDVLRKKLIPLSDQQLFRVEDAVKLCALNLDMPVSALLQSDKMFQLQRRVADVTHERAWMDLFNSLPSDFERVRRLEYTGPIARAWIQALPTDKSLTMSVDEIRYGLRDIFLSHSVSVNQKHQTVHVSGVVRQTSRGRSTSSRVKKTKQHALQGTMQSATH